MINFRSKTWLSDWLRKHMPTREQLKHNRYVRPFAHWVLRSELWRFTRRSVPRGVAIGLLVSIFVLVPGIQIVGAALLCVPCRANIPLGAAMTFLSNPVTTPLFILPGALWIGSKLGFHSDAATFKAMIADGTSVAEWWAWLWSDGAPALILGLFVIATLAASAGYVVSGIFWRMVVGRKWMRRKAHRDLPPDVS